jgi:hypothetical protein
MEDEIKTIDDLAARIMKTMVSKEDIQGLASPTLAMLPSAPRPWLGGGPEHHD